MKSRATTYLLLTAVAAVWGIVAWKIFAPGPGNAQPVPVPTTEPKPAERIADTLFADYSDPFLKGSASKTSAPRASSVVRTLPPAPVPKIRRDNPSAVHLGTVAAQGRALYILTVGGEQYEVRRGESAGEFTLCACDDDSLYLCRDGITYGVRRCE